MSIVQSNWHGNHQNWQFITAQWSSSLGRRWHNCSKRFRKLTNEYVLVNVTRIKAHTCLYLRFSFFRSFRSFPDLDSNTHFFTNFSQILSILWTFENNFRGLFMLLNSFETLFCSKYTQKLQKTQIYVNLFGWPRGFCHPFRPLWTGENVLRSKT